MAYTKYKRFGLSVQQWLAESTDLVTLTGHVNTASGQRIIVASGHDLLASIKPSLLLFIEHAGPWLEDVDAIQVSIVRCISYGSSRIQSLDIAGAVEEHAKQQSTQKDKVFTKNNIRTRGIKSLPFEDHAMSKFDPSSMRRTERSDIAVPNVFITEVPLNIRWIDIS